MFFYFAKPVASVPILAAGNAAGVKESTNREVSAV